MKVIVYFNGSYPFGSASTNRIHQLCKGLIANRIETQIIITNPTENSKNTLNKFRSGIYQGISYTYISKSTIRKKNLVLRKLIDIYSYLKIFYHVLCKTDKTDKLIIVGGATFDFRIPLVILGNLLNKSLFLEINEYPFINQTNTFFRRFKEFLFFKLVVPQYTGFIVISQLLMEKIDYYKRSDSRIIKIPILSDIEFDVDKKKPPFPEPYIIHAGSMYEEKDGIIGSIQAYVIARQMIQNRLLYVIAGNLNSSPHKEEILKLIERNNLRNEIIFLGNLDKNTLYYYLHFARMAILNKPSSQQNLYGFATKISEYVTHKIPLILTKVGEINSYFSDGHNSLLFEYGDTNQLVKAIVKLNNDEKLRIDISDKAYSLALNEFNPKNNGSLLKSFLSL